MSLMQVFDRCWNEPKMGEQVTEVVDAARTTGVHSGWLEGYLAAKDGAPAEEQPFQDVNTDEALMDQLRKLEKMEFPVLQVVRQCLADHDPIAKFKHWVEESDRVGRERAEKEGSGRVVRE